MGVPFRSWAPLGGRALAVPAAEAVAEISHDGCDFGDARLVEVGISPVWLLIEHRRERRASGNNSRMATAASSPFMTGIA
jgi:hypothetical protein